MKLIEDEEIVIELLNMILPDQKIEKVKVDVQKSVEAGLDIHGVRFDVYVKDVAGVAYVVEMQVVNQKWLAKRARYYGSIDGLFGIGKRQAL